MPVDAPANTIDVRAAHQFDETKLQKWMQRNIEGFSGDLTVRQFNGGQSNPTFWMSDTERSYVLRKKPPGKLLPSAHAVDREYRVMKALADTDVPVAEMYGLCEDDSVIGTSFFLMEHVQGRIFWNVQLPELRPQERIAMYDEHVRVLAALHKVDVHKVGLSDFGRPDRYVARQVSRWTKQYNASETLDVAPMNALMAWLPENVPGDDESVLAHGDYRFDNILMHPKEPKALALIDWELSTIGHPLADLAYVCMLYHVVLPNIGGLFGVNFEATGIPNEDDYVTKYCELTGRRGIADFGYYKAFSLFRLAAIAQGVYKRSLQGNASSQRASSFKHAAGQLAGIACQIVGVTP